MKTRLFLFSLLFPLLAFGQGPGIWTTTPQKNYDPEISNLMSFKKSLLSGHDSISSYSLTNDAIIFDNSYVTVAVGSLYYSVPGLSKLPNGTLICVYRGGTAHASTDGDLFYKLSIDQGATWGSENTLATHSGSYGYSDVEIETIRNGTLIVSTFCNDGINAHGAYTFIGSPSNNIITWAGPYLAATNRATSSKVIDYGTKLLLPVYDNYSTNALLLTSLDNGKSWGNEIVIANYGTNYWNEANGLILPDNTIRMFVRDGIGVQGGIGLTYSSDYGLTWVNPTNVIACQPGRPSPIRLANGNLLMFCRASTNYSANGYPAIRTSLDNGLTWSTESIILTNTGPGNTGNDYGSVTHLSGNDIGLVLSMYNPTNVLCMQVSFKTLHCGQGVFADGNLQVKKATVGSILATTNIMLRATTSPVLGIDSGDQSYLQLLHNAVAKWCLVNNAEGTDVLSLWDYNRSDSVLVFHPNANIVDFKYVDVRVPSLMVTNGLWVGGNVGIGTTTPSDKLQVYGGNIIIDSNAYIGNSTYNNLVFQPSAGTSVQNASTDVRINIDSNNNGTGDYFEIAHNVNTMTGGTVLFRVQDDGNVGIGTTGPGSLLDVNGTAQLRGSSGGTGLYVNSVGAVGIGTTSIDSWALLKISGTNPYFYFAGSGTGIFQTASTMAFSIRGGTDTIFNSWVGSDWQSNVTIKNNGNVGIGTAAPTTNLCVNGEASASTMVSTNGFGSATNYTAGKFTPVSGQGRLVISNNVLYFVTASKTNVVISNE